MELQLRDLRAYALHRGLCIEREYVDAGISGSKDQRPALNELMDGAKKRHFDTVLVWRFDRFARSTRHLLQSLDEFRSLGIDFISFQENIDTTSPLGKAMFTIISAINELEKNIIVSRVRAGLANAKAKGRKLGRPPRINHGQVLELRTQGFSLSQIGKKVGATKSAVSKLISKSRLNKGSKPNVLETG